MASGGARVIRGSFVGTGAQLDIRTIGFRPRAIKLWNQSAPASAEWIEGMADAKGIKRVTAGDASEMSAGITPLSDGFRLGTDADLNTDTEVVYYEATE